MKPFEVTSKYHKKKVLVNPRTWIGIYNLPDGVTVSFGGEDDLPILETYEEVKAIVEAAARD